MSERLINHEDFGALAGEVLKQGSSFKFRAHGNSMRPFIYNGDTVELIGEDPDRIRRGDIVLCWLTKEFLLLHRVIRVQKTDHGLIFTIQGDAFSWPDGVIPAENVIGKAAAVLRRGKWVALDTFPMATLSKIWLILIPARRLASRAAGAVRSLLLK